MTSQRSSFEYIERYLRNSLDDDAYSEYYGYLNLVRQDAQADQAERVKELEKAGADLIRINMERTTENSQLQLENQKLRDALENIAFEADLRWIDRAVQEALGETK